MLMVLDESLACYTICRGGIPDNVKRAIDLLALCAREGKHLVVGTPRVLLAILKDRSLNDVTKAFLRSALERFPQLLPLQGILSVQARIVSDEAGSYGETVVGGVLIKQIPISHFNDSFSIQKVIILTEHKTDAEIVFKMADYYRFTRGLTRVPVKGEIRCGGGSNTAPQLVDISQQRERLCVCVVDSDRKSPGGPIGDTAKKIRSVIQSAPSPLVCAIVLAAREMENLIPHEIFASAFGQDHARKHIPILVQELTVNGLDHIRFHIDLKEGLTLGSVFSFRVGPDGDFWREAWRNIIACYRGTSVDQQCVRSEQCPSHDNCGCKLLLPGGSKILETTVDALKRWSPQDLAGIHGPWVNEWETIGKVVFEWCCGSNFASA